MDPFDAQIEVTQNKDVVTDIHSIDDPGQRVNVLVHNGDVTDTIRRNIENTEEGRALSAFDGGPNLFNSSAVGRIEALTSERRTNS